MEKQLTACEFLNSPSKSWCKQYPSERVNQPVMTASRACPAPPQVEPSNHESLTFGHRMPCTATPSEQMRQRSQPSRKRTRWRSTGHWHPPPANMLSKVGKSWEIHIKFCGHEFKVAGNPFSKPVAFPWKKTLEHWKIVFSSFSNVYISICPFQSFPIPFILHHLILAYSVLSIFILPKWLGFGIKSIFLAWSSKHTG